MSIACMPFQYKMNLSMILNLCKVFLAFSVLLLPIHYINKLLKAKKLPPGPIGIPLVGNLHQLSIPIHRSLQIQAKQHGPLMFMQLGSVPTLIISSADVLEDIFKTHDLVFSGRPVLYAAKKLSYNFSSISFAPYGQKWRDLKKIATVELLSAKRVQSFREVRKEEVKSMLSSVANSSSGLINLSKLTLMLSNNVVCRVAFGRKYDDGETRLDRLLSEAQELLGGFCVADYFPWLGWMCKFNGLEARLEETFRELDKLYDRIIEEHLDPNRKKPEQDDLVDVLIRIQKDPSTTEAALTHNCIKGVLTDMFIAGTDTSSATLVWTMTELIRNPLVMERTKEEIRGVTKEKDMVEESDLPKLKYLKSVVKESMRFHPPAPLLIPRETTEDCRIGEYEIPARTRVIINAASILMDPESWQNPGEFRPERFLNTPNDSTRQHFEHIPFGVGRRQRPGINFSTVLIELALANLLHRFNWELPNGALKDDLDMEEASGITMHKKTHLCLQATPVNLDYL